MDLNFRLNEDFYNQLDLCSKQDFWGTAQQLFCGKIISDAMDTNPILESIVHPTGGIVGPGDHVLNKAIKFATLLVINEKILLRHSIAHDAYGYLYKIKNIGPGYTYVDWNNAFGQFPLIAGNPLSDQLDGMCWWLKRHYEPIDDRFIQGKLEMDHYTPAKM